MKIKILVVDDEPDVIDFLSRRLESCGYEVVAAVDGQEGLRAAIETRPALILLDILMPNMDGLSTLKALKAHEATKDVPVVMLTAQSESSSIFMFQQLGALDYIVKPFQFEELLKFIRKYTL